MKREGEIAGCGFEWKQGKEAIRRDRGLKSGLRGGSGARVGGRCGAEPTGQPPHIPASPARDRAGAPPASPLPKTHGSDHAVPPDRSTSSRFLNARTAPVPELTCSTPLSGLGSAPPLAACPVAQHQALATQNTKFDIPRHNRTARLLSSHGVGGNAQKWIVPFIYAPWRLKPRPR